MSAALLARLGKLEAAIAPETRIVGFRMLADTPSNGRPVFPGSRFYLVDDAEQHTEQWCKNDSCLRMTGAG